MNNGLRMEVSDLAKLANEAGERRSLFWTVVWV